MIESTQRRKERKVFIAFVQDFLCGLCVFALKAVLIYDCLEGLM
jgi:hypothetical protein